VSKGQPSQELMPSGIGDRRIEDPESVISTHSHPVKSETSIGERTVVSWTSRSHEKGVSQRELRSGDRCHRGSGIGDPWGKKIATPQVPISQ
jgi:hypothetical protein